jgi:imidazolonepropionase-like amidohydrolase
MANMKLEKEYMFIGVTLIDGNGGPPVKDTVILVKNGVIEEVCSRNSIRSKEGVQQIVLSEYFVMPGLFDAHLHFTGRTNYNPIDWITTPNYLQAMRVVGEAEKLLDYGFTTVRSGGSRYDIQLRRAIAEGAITGPRVIACGLALSRTRGHGDSLRRDLYDVPDEWVQQSHPWAQTCDGVEGVRNAVRKLVGQNVDHVKFLATGGGSWKRNRCEDTQYTREEMQTIVNEAHMVGLKVMCHAENYEAVRTVVELGVDMIEHCDDDSGSELDDETCRKMADKNIFITPTLSINFVGPWSTPKIRQSTINGWERAIKNGVKVLLGSDAGVDPLTPFGKFNIGEMKLLVDTLGLSPLEAISSGTKLAAESCEISNKVGTIEKGKLADLLVLKKDPSSNVDVLLDKENIKYVIKEGNLVVEH